MIPQAKMHLLREAISHLEGLRGEASKNVVCALSLLRTELKVNEVLHAFPGGVIVSTGEDPGNLTCIPPLP